MDGEAWSAYHSSDSKAQEFNEEEVLLQDGFCLQMASLQVQDLQMGTLLMIKL